MKSAFLALAICLATIPAQAFTGTVVGNHDGDTAYVRLQSGQEIIVRLANVDTPETDQPFGKRAGRALHDLTYGKKVEIDYRGEYPYREREREIIGVIHAPYDVSEEMIREGIAWDYVRYDTDPAIPGLEQQARARRVGLWSQPAIPPWEWRRMHRQGRVGW